MRTRDSILMSKLLGASSATAEEASGALGASMFSKALSASGGWKSLSPKPGDRTTHEVMKWALQYGSETDAEPIGRGIHRPYRVRFSNGMQIGHVTTKAAAFKTIYCQRESSRYCKAVDVAIGGPEREILCYELDRVLGFDLIPPTIIRDLSQIGFGSVQAWVDQPTGFQWIGKGYDYRLDKKNPWLHRLAAFDFISGQIDRHSNNWVMDDLHRVYAIDNGYAFVKGDERTYMKSNAGKNLVGHPLHPLVLAEIRAIDEKAVAGVLSDRGFQNGEEEGVLERIRELKGLEVWTRLGELW